MSDSEVNIHHIVDHCVKTIGTFSNFLDVWNIEFFNKRHWDKLPPSWQEEFRNGVEPQELVHLLKYTPHSSGKVWPLSLLCICAISSNFSLPQSLADQKLKIWSCVSDWHLSCNSEQQRCPRSDESHNNHCDLSLHTANVCALDNSKENKNPTSEMNNNADGLLQNNWESPCFTHPRLSNIFCRKVKLKKRHEVFKMAKVTHNMAQLQDCQYVIDIGSGVGHLARMLTYGFGLKVCCLELNNSLSDQARNLDIKLEKMLSKYLSSEEMSRFHRPVHINFVLNSETTPSHIVQLLSSAFNTTSDVPVKFGIVGLHPCGDLGPMLLKLFKLCSSASFINVIGCCYMKLTTSINAKYTGFPLSTYLINRKYTLKIESLDLATHAVEHFAEKLQQGKDSILKVHCFRAALETIIVKHWPDLQRMPIKNIKHSDNITFSEFSMKAITGLGKEVDEEELHSEEVSSYLHQWKHVLIFYTLRLLIAPVVETVILLDRLLYLRESGINSSLLPLFDPSISPRNHILIATKQDSNS